MKVKNLKTRIAAFGLAVLMGVSTLSSANAFAAEQTDVGQEVQASEQAVTSQKEQAVTADDITKNPQYNQNNQQYGQYPVLF